MQSFSRHRQAGFTLVEIAIVLVIIGLILGGVLKGQELVTSARVRNIADQQNAIKAAFFAFQDRYKAVPGDYSAASTTIPGLAPASNGGAAVDGSGDGFIYFIQDAALPASETNESVWAFLHMSAAGFLACSPCMNTGAAGGAPSALNSPSNAYNGVMQLAYDNCFGAALTACPADLTGAGTTKPNLANNLKTGSNIPSNILAEVDSKLDDGNPNTGSFQFSPYSAGATKPSPGSCLTGSGPYQWNRQSPSTNCGAAYTF